MPYVVGPHSQEGPPSLSKLQLTGQTRGRECLPTKVRTDQTGHRVLLDGSDSPAVQMRGCVCVVAGQQEQGREEEVNTLILSL